MSTVQAAISTVCRTVVAIPITCSENASMTSLGTQGEPGRAVMSDGRKSSGCTRRSASTFRS